MVRVILKRLVGEDGRSRRYNLAQLEVIFNLFDLHIFKNEAEILVGVECALGMIPKVRFGVCTREERNTSRGRDQPELLRVLTSSRLELEPTAKRRWSAQNSSLTQKRAHSLVVVLSIA